VAPAGEAPRQWIVRVREGERWSYTILPGSVRRFVVRRPGGAAASPAEVAVTPVDRLGNEGATARIRP
jgi:hypothetical protein